MTRGRGRGGSSASMRAKRAVSPELDDYTEPLPKKQRKAPQKAPPEPREPSTRTTRGIPAEKLDFEITVPRTNRPHAEVQAEKDRRAAEALARQKELAIAMERVAVLNAEVDQAAADDELNAIDSLGDLPEDDNTMLEFTEVDFQRVEDDDEYQSASEYAPKTKKKSAVAVPAKVGKAKKPQKGETKEAMEELMRKLKAKGVGAKKKSVQNSDAAAASKRAGLSTTYLATTRKAVKAGTSPGNSKAARSNETIHIESGSDSEDSEDTPIRVAAAMLRPVPKRRDTVKVKPEPKIPALAVGSFDTKTPTAKKKRVKLEADSSSLGFTPVSAGNVRGLPALVGPMWETLALPALYRALYRSSEPMIFAAKGDTAVSEAVALKAIREVIDQVYPGNTLPTFMWNDELCDRGVRRVRERRSLIIQTCTQVVDAFFATKKYLGNPTAIRDYAKYALRVDGPATWKTPTPESCPRNPEAPGYIKPADYMESPMMIQIASSFLKNEELTLPVEHDDGSFDASGMPTGLFGLIAGGLERGFKLYSRTGQREAQVPKFKVQTYNTAINAYVSNIQRFTLSRWTSLLAALGPTTVVTTAAEATDDELDGHREYAYVKSSP
ncbi:hypothetical protein K438DRAFT_2030436 [Mycena galopus ATCC 62051]|nr:hypothetical protein K438DRAFT_2030436 [Mycena galopus ATCC 62051]